MQVKKKKNNGFIQRKDQVVWRSLKEKGFLLDLKSGAYFEVNSFGLTLWKLLDGKRTVAELTLLASRRFTIPLERIREDVYNFINDLKRNKLIEIV